MAKTVTYAMPGYIDARLSIPINQGRATVVFHFTGGMPTDTGASPATYSTGNEAEQMLIEKSGYFNRSVYRMNEKGGLIIREAAPVEAAPKLEPRYYPEVETIAQATEAVLEHGATATEAADADSVLDYARRNMLVFPNLSRKKK